MNLNSSHSQLLDLNKQALIKWQELNGSWNDSNAKKFESEFVLPLLKKLELSVNSINEINEVFNNIKADFPHE